MKHSEQTDALSDALSKAQAVMAGAKKDAANPFFKSKYADLASCWEACKGALTSNGIAVVQGNTPHDGGVQVQTRLMHKSGQWVEDDGLFVPATKADAQGFGSALTYARRYSLCAMVGIAPEDDDGNAAVKTAPKNWPAPQQATVDDLDDFTPEERLGAVQKHARTIQTIKDALADMELKTAAGLWYSLTEKEQRMLWFAPTKGGPFTTDERKLIKTPEFRMSYHRAEA